MKKIILLIYVSLIHVSFYAQDDELHLADPFIIEDQGVFYAYGTSNKMTNEGIAVYESKDLKHWQGTCGLAEKKLALHKNDAWGNEKFWAPEVYKINNKYIMTYTAEGQIAIAESDSPRGPFKQTGTPEPYIIGQKGIDSHIYIDDDGTPYIYWVRFGLGKGNEIRVSRLRDDLKKMKGEQIQCLYSTPDTWERCDEDTTRKVAEAPFILKHKGYYYLSYSCNTFRAANYSVGYATSKSPLGPWERSELNPILFRHGGYAGTGHHAFFTTSRGEMYIVYHAHKDANTALPRKMLISPCRFLEQDNAPDAIVIDDEVIVPIVIKK